MSVNTALSTQLIRTLDSHTLMASWKAGEDQENVAGSVDIKIIDQEKDILGIVFEGLVSSGLTRYSIHLDMRSDQQLRNINCSAAIHYASWVAEHARFDNENNPLNQTGTKYDLSGQSIKAQHIPDNDI